MVDVLSPGIKYRLWIPIQWLLLHPLSRFAGSTWFPYYRVRGGTLPHNNMPVMFQLCVCLFCSDTRVISAEDLEYTPEHHGAQS